MYTEIVKIIEGGINKESQKVYNYAKHLEKKLREEGDTLFADKILKVLLKGKNGTTVFQDSLIASPIDNETKLSIADIGLPGAESQKLVLTDSLLSSINEFVQFVNNKEKLQKAGLEFSASLLLYGPPGCGKTSIAKHIANELNLPIVIARFDTLISSLLGSTSKNIRKLFDYANSKPCILFLDEFDAIAKDRKDKQEQGELKRVINSLLQNIDGFLINNILIAATNHHELLDDAIWRRFEKVIGIENPSEKYIKHLISDLISKVTSDLKSDNKKLTRLANLLEGQSNSEIKKVIINTLSKAVLKDKKEVNYEDFVFEIFQFLNKNNYTNEKAVKFLNEHGISQQLISEYFNISLRQVRNLLKSE